MLSPEIYWAKGLRGSDTVGESLAAHTAAVVQRVAALRERAPFLAQLCESPRLWHRLGLVATVHDLGKTDPGFQRMVKESTKEQRVHYGQRHEVLSLAWLDWLLGDDPHADRLTVATAVASHHRDSSVIFEKYNQGTVFRPTTNIPDLLSPLPDDLFQQAADYFLDYLLPELQAARLLAEDWVPPARWSATPDDKRLAERSIARHLRLWECAMQEPADADTRRVGILVRGLILLADHAGSAHADFRSVDLLKDPSQTRTRLAPPKELPYFPHQDQTAAAVGHALLIAPTGSGKTEAALRWAANQYAQSANAQSPNPAAGGHPPLFYVLPFKASLNAMQRRLVDKLTPATDGGATRVDLVALQHSSALLVMYHQLMNEPATGATARSVTGSQAAWLARRQQELAKLHTTPIRVLSPYQLLRGAYQLKGHEALWTDAAGGLFIFDEIHAYEAPRLARILEMLRFLIDRFGARALVMTATMPPPIQRYVSEILGHPEPICATEATYAQFRRHRLRLCETGLLDDATITQIVNRIQDGEAVLCVATTVKRAQQLQRKLQRLLGEHTPVKLLHSRFTGEDRDHLETEVRNAVATQVTAAQRQKIVLVATQVVEVSLDVDFDVLFSDPAPIEALLQRFGRVNRSRRPEPHDVVVCTVEEDAQPVYDGQLVSAALQTLQVARDTVIDESQVQQWINRVYKGAIGDQLLRGIQQAAAEFRKTVLDVLQPFETQEEVEKLFYEQFDGAEVLPKSLVPRYTELLDSDQLRASMLTVPISQKQLKRLQGQRLIQLPTAVGLPPKSPLVANVPYDSTNGLQLDLPAGEEHT